MIYGVFERRHGWFRVLGYGIGWKDTRVVRPLFSERNGLKRHYRIGAWSFQLLTPED